LNPNGDYKMDDLLRDAIADAKAVRETALANAKIALEEAFTPRLQSMLSKKIAAEVENSDEEEAEEGEHEENMHGHEEGEHEEGEHEEGMHDAEEMRDADEMDAEEMDAEEMRNADEEEMDEAEDAEETEDSEEMRDMKETEDAEEEDKEEMREEEDAEEEDKVDEAEDAEETEDADENELDLESVLAELEKDLDDEDDIEEEYNTDEVGDGMNKDEVETDEEKLAENDVSSDIGKGDNKVAPAANDSSKVGQGPESEGSDKKAGDELGDHETVDDLTEVEDKDEEDLDLDEVLRALTEEEAEEQDAEENEKLKAEIKEHRKVIHFMRSKLNEVNLLNAKLLFSNKLFRAFGLNNNQKLKVVETFDRTKNLREVKLVYATLAESFKRPGKRISESVRKGSSSKPVRSTKPKAVLSEGAELRNRFKKLANIL
jgi:hypothetical protein